MTIILNLAVPFFGLVLLGAIAGKAFRAEESGLAWLNIFVFYFAVPPLVFQSVVEAPVDKLFNWTFIAITTFSGYLVFIIVFAIAVVVFRARMARAAIQASAASYSNLVYLGLPLAIATFGQDAAVPATLIACFDNLVQFTLVPLIAAFDERESEPLRETALKIFRQVVQNPLILAAVLGGLVAVLEVPLPGALETLIDYLARAAAPAALFAMGLTVVLRPYAGFTREVPVILLAKMVLHPMLVLGLLRLFGGVDPVWAGVAVLMAALPTAANVFVLATRHNAYVEGASNIILISTVLSVLTVTTLLFLIDHQYLP